MKSVLRIRSKMIPLRNCKLFYRCLLKVIVEAKASPRILNDLPERVKEKLTITATEWPIDIGRVCAASYLLSVSSLTLIDFLYAPIRSPSSMAYYFGLNNVISFTVMAIWSIFPSIYTGLNQRLFFDRPFPHIFMLVGAGAIVKMQFIIKDIVSNHFPSTAMVGLLSMMLFLVDLSKHPYRL